MWSNKQKAWLNQLLKLSKVKESEYRETLSGLYDKCKSSTDSRLTHEDFSEVMAWAERRINDAISNGLITLKEVFDVTYDPWKFNREILRKNESSEAIKTPMQVTRKGLASQEQINKIVAIRHEFKNIGLIYDLTYFCGIVEKATRTTCEVRRLDDLTMGQASALIDALDDRYYAEKRKRKEQNLDENPPF